MSRNYHKVAGAESEAFKKLTGGLKHCIEAATELGVRRQDRRWSEIALTFEKLLTATEALWIKAQSNAVQGSRMQ